MRGYSIASNYVKYLINIAFKWQRVWEEEKVFEANPDISRRKFFITAAFMYPNAPAHIGHARVYVIGDVLSRFMRMLGYNVLYPMGFHYTGTPILAMAEAIASGDKNLIRELMELYRLSEEEVRVLGDPLSLAKYFHRRSKEAMIRVGLGVDWRREFTTVDEEFKSFIRWQFEKLRQRGFIERGSHPVGWCPSHQMPVGMHDTKDDVEPEIGEVTFIFFISSTDKDLLLPVATLRPETILGVTNLWVRPDVDYDICEIEYGGIKRRVVLSHDAAYRYSFQFKVSIIGKVKGSELVGLKVFNPLSGEQVEVLEADFVDPKFGTGLVMSVPAHAPYDYVALLEFASKSNPKAFRVIPLIKVPNYSEIPAKDVVERLGIRSQREVDLLDKATKEVYLNEFSLGVMRDDLHNLVVRELILNAREFIKNNVNNLPVSRARDAIKRFLIENLYAITVYEIMNKPVYCRCGAEVVVKVLENQWFINYGDPEWKRLTSEALESMRLVPEEARRQYEATIKWLQRKACARSRGLGTELPWEKGWIIESLSDSTIYMAFYTVINKIREFRIPYERLSEEFWDYVMLGKGDVIKLSMRLGIPQEHLIKLREEFTYWYPLDVRLSGKDLIPNHLTFFIFNHVAIFPRELWPKAIITNGWVLREGEKMSKSKRNVLTLEEAIERYSPDGVRATLILAAEVEQDLDFRESLARSIIEHLIAIESLISNIYDLPVRDVISLPDRWLLTRLQRHIKSISDDLLNARLRSAAVKVFYMMYQDLIDYLLMTNKTPSAVVRTYVDAWTKMLAPFIPHLAEELWHKIGNKGLLVNESWPTYNKDLIDVEAELSIEFVRSLINDVREVMKLIRGGNELVLYVSNREDYQELIDVIDLINSGKTLNEIIRLRIKDLRTRDVENRIKRLKRLYDLATSLSPEIRDLILTSRGLDEYAVLKELIDYIKAVLPISNISIYYSRDENAPDFGGKKGMTIPFKPGIYVQV